MSRIAEAMERNANVMLVITASDLRDFGMDLYLQGRADASGSGKKKAYTREEAASLLRVSVRTIDYMRKQGAFGTAGKQGNDKLNGRVLLQGDKVEAMIP